MNLYNFKFGTDDDIATKLTEGFTLHLCKRNCEFLNPLEKDQKKYEQHFCTKYNQQVFHGIFHPRIIAVKNCKFSSKIKGEIKCPKEKKVVKCLQTAPSSPPLRNAIQNVISIIQKMRIHLKKWMKLPKKKYRK